MRAVLLALLALAAQPVLAQNVPPSEDSVRHLLDLMQTHRILDEAMSNMDSFTQKALEQVRQGEPTLNAKQQQIADQFHTDMMSAIKDELAWSKVEPEIVSVYVKTFSQKEINDMITFYSTPSGQAVTSKLPMVSREMSANLQERMMPLIQRIKQSARDMQAKMKAAGSE
ncbi:MAG TPA: DUF2059 domain-containing protein [Steroidobacteraceae bacterium]|nr:DUF2059 domain-containing protein [Steroidobacteraceae bacterium]